MSQIPVERITSRGGRLPDDTYDEYDREYDSESGSSLTDRSDTPGRYTRPSTDASGDVPTNPSERFRKARAVFGGLNNSRSVEIPVRREAGSGGGVRSEGATRPVGAQSRIPLRVASARGEENVNQSAHDDGDDAVTGSDAGCGESDASWVTVRRAEGHDRSDGGRRRAATQTDDGGDAATPADPGSGEQRARGGRARRHRRHPAPWRQGADAAAYTPWLYPHEACPPGRVAWRLSHHDGCPPPQYVLMTQQPTATHYDPRAFTALRTYDTPYESYPYLPYPRADPPEAFYSPPPPRQWPVGRYRQPTASAVRQSPRYPEPALVAPSPSRRVSSSSIPELPERDNEEVGTTHLNQCI